MLRLIIIGVIAVSLSGCISIAEHARPEQTEQAIRLFEANPGTTFVWAHTPALRFYKERIEAFREILSQMSPATARRIAHENAERLFDARRTP